MTEKTKEIAVRTRKRRSDTKYLRQLRRIDPENPVHGNKLAVNGESVFRLALIHCTVEEIAATLNCCVTTIKNRFMPEVHRGHEEGQMSLKRKLHEKALAGDSHLLIWLSKQRLGYKDKSADEVTQIAFCVYVNEIPK